MALGRDAFDSLVFGAIFFIFAPKSTLQDKFIFFVRRIFRGGSYWEWPSDNFAAVLATRERISPPEYAFLGPLG